MSPLELLPKQSFDNIHTVGIPRALLYYRYHVLWQTFFESLGCTVVVSNPSDRAMLERGEALSIDECCLASKLYMGHVESLLDSCDALFVPSIDNLGLHKGFCTKFQALPDLVANTFPSKKDSHHFMRSRQRGHRYLCRRSLRIHSYAIRSEQKTGESALSTRLSRPEKT